MTPTLPSNRERIEKLLIAVEKALAPYVEGHMHKIHGPHWRQYARIPKSLAPKAKVDAHAALWMIVNNWQEVFQNELKPAARDAASAALAGRNAYAHTTSELDDDKTLRALSGGKEILDLIGAATEAKIVGDHFEEHQQKMVVARLRATGKLPKEGAPEKPVAAATPPKAPELKLRHTTEPAPKPIQGDLLGGGDVEGLKPWRTVMPPREEVLSGSLNKDAFAANLAVVDRAYRGEGDVGLADPVAFLEATHVTNGLQMVLEKAAKRFVGDEAPSTIGLQTNFGGGKTHALLALLHMAKLGDLAASEVLAPVRSSIVRDRLPDVRTVVFSGVDKGPDQPLERADGAPIRTLWGYIAWHVAGREGMQLVAESEERGTNPGAETIQRLLELTGDATLVLLDELVVFVRQLDLQRFEAHLSFLQSLTEAAAQVKNALVVGSLPESDIEAGQEQGREALRRLEKLFGRVQSPWEPAQGVETYAVVRRRLFQAEDDAGIKERERTVKRFHKLYKDNKADFPAFASQPDYLERMMSAYPVHPMLFDVLSDQWGALDKFQRTRGVLSLIARAIYNLYMHERNEPLILPSALRMSDPAMKGALIEPLAGAHWSAIIDGEIDGEKALSWSLEQGKKRYGSSSAARRAARAVFLATAPGDSAKAAQTAAEVRLACVTPGEQLSLFPEALRELADQSAHLYVSDGRFWYGSKPTLNRTAQLREADIEGRDIDAEIVRLLKEDNGRKGGWSRVHVAPSRALEVGDERSSALVVLGPDYPYDDGGASAAEEEALDGLERRAGGQRKYRNALVFLAADTRGLEDCRRLVRKALAWQSVKDDRTLELTDSQKDAARSSFESALTAARLQIRKAWTRLLVPTQDPLKGNEVIFDVENRRQSGDRSAAEHAWDVARKEPFVIENLGPRTLADKVEEFWRPEEAHLCVDTVRDWYFQYLHMERPRDEQVVADAIADAAAMIPTAPFGIADRYDGTRYEGLSLSRNVCVTFGTGMVLVGTTIAEEQLAADQTPQSPVTQPQGATAGGLDEKPGDPFQQHADGQQNTAQRKPRRFVGVVSLDPNRGPITVNQIFEAIVSELDRAGDATIELTLEVKATSPSGFASDVVDVVRDNATSTGFGVATFDE